MIGSGLGHAAAGRPGGWLWGVRLVALVTALVVGCATPAPAGLELGVDSAGEVASTGDGAWPDAPPSGDGGALDGYAELPPTDGEGQGGLDARGGEDSVEPDAADAPLPDGSSAGDLLASDAGVGDVEPPPDDAVETSDAGVSDTEPLPDDGVQPSDAPVLSDSSGADGDAPPDVAVADDALAADEGIQADDAPAEADAPVADADLPPEDAAAPLDALPLEDVEAPADAGTDDAGITLDAGAPLGDVPSWVPEGVGASPCTMAGEHPAGKGIALVPAFPNLPMSQPIFLTHPGDGTDRIVVAQRSGKLVIFENDPTVSTSSTLLNLAGEVASSGEGGLLSCAFHPDYAMNGRVYVSFTRWADPATTANLESVIAEFTLSSIAPDTLDPASRRELYTVVQPWSNHNGGQILFDASGKLLIAFGDGGSGGDPLNAGQSPGTPLGKVLRIDVDVEEGPYGVPSDNPLLGVPGHLPETFAFGVRNPWRVSRDRLTGALWMADVGQGIREEVDLLVGGANYGWKIWEGTHCYSPASGCPTAGFTFPVAEYGHDEGKSITGGFVYRGLANPSLYGRYLYGDYSTGRFWALDTSTHEVAVVANAAFSPVSFGEDRDGELYVTQLWGQPGIARIVEQLDPPTTPFPPKLSATGCFSDISSLTPAAGLIPYEVRAPLWSDGAEKQRWWVPPPGTPAVVPPEDVHEPWSAPIGTVLIKHFDQAGPVETRFMVRRADGWRFVTYAWDADGTDAVLSDGGGEDWLVPSPGQCATCHRGGTDATRPLGLTSAQLDREHPQGGPQLEGLVNAGLLASLPPASPLPLQGGSPPFQTSLDADARAWLHVQCGSCHAPGGTSPAGIDLRFDQPLEAMGLCKSPSHGGGPGTRIILPGAPEDSMLWRRLSAAPADAAFMPPLGVSVAQEDAIALIAAWIESLGEGCP